MKESFSHRSWRGYSHFVNRSVPVGCMVLLSAYVCVSPVALVLPGGAHVAGWLAGGGVLIGVHIGVFISVHIGVLIGARDCRQRAGRRNAELR